MRRRMQSRSLQGFTDVKRVPPDYTLLTTIILLVVFGLIMVYDSSVVQAFKDHADKYYYIKQQLIWVVLGFLSLSFFSFFNYRHLRVLALPGFLFSVLLLLAVFIPGLGVQAGGAHRWLDLGFFTVQPAEIIKLSTIIFFATLFEKKARAAPFAIVLLVVSIIVGVFQRDLGSTIVFFLTAVAVYIASGAKLSFLVWMVPISVIGFLGFVLTSAYRKARILAFLDPFGDPQGYSYHISQVLIALGSGGITGMGLGQSRQKFEYIPEVTTDSIFAIVGEEFGFLGSLFLIALLCYLVYRGFKIAENAPDNFGKLLAFGLTAAIGIQTLINLGAMVSLFPLTGVPLPFISYGGSALLINLMAVGILLNISKSSKNSS